MTSTYLLALPQEQKAVLETQCLNLIFHLDNFETTKQTLDLFSSLIGEEIDIIAVDLLLFAIAHLEAQPDYKALCAVKVAALTIELDYATARAFNQDRISDAVLAYVKQRGPSTKELVRAINDHADSVGIQRYLIRFFDKLHLFQVDALLATLVRAGEVTALSPYLPLFPSLDRNLLEAVVDTGKVDALVDLGPLDQTSVMNLCGLILSRKLTPENRSGLEHLLTLNPLAPELYGIIQEKVEKYVKG